MTCREKLALDHPDWDSETLEHHVYNDCPHEYGYVVDGCSTMDGNCTRCWNQHVPEEGDIRIGNKLIYACTPPFTEKFEKPVKTEKPVIKDSGNRREFESGAVRDMQEGKGRFDLVPLEIVSDLLGTKEISHDPIMLDIATFMYDYDTCWLAAALENFADKAYNGCLYTMFLEVAKHFEAGAKKYEEHNWKKGIPIKCYIDSAVRHYMKWCRGDNDEPHDRAFTWNLMCCMWEREYGEEWRKSGGSEENVYRRHACDVGGED